MWCQRQQEAELSNPNQAALDAGFTREIFATSSEYDLYLLIKPDADLDGTFRAWDSDCFEWLKVNGWQFSIEDAPGLCAGPFDGILRKEA